MHFKAISNRNFSYSSPFLIITLWFLTMVFGIRFKSKHKNIFSGINFIHSECIITIILRFYFKLMIWECSRRGSWMLGALKMCVALKGAVGSLWFWFEPFVKTAQIHCNRQIFHILHFKRFVDTKLTKQLQNESSKGA